MAVSSKSSQSRCFLVNKVNTGKSRKLLEKRQRWKIQDCFLERPAAGWRTKQLRHAQGASGSPQELRIQAKQHHSKTNSGPVPCGNPGGPIATHNTGAPTHTPQRCARTDGSSKPCLAALACATQKPLVNLKGSTQSCLFHELAHFLLQLVFQS